MSTSMNEMTQTDATNKSRVIFVLDYEHFNE